MPEIIAISPEGIPEVVIPEKLPEPIPNIPETIPEHAIIPPNLVPTPLPELIPSEVSLTPEIILPISAPKKNRAKRLLRKVKVLSRPAIGHSNEEEYDDE